MRKRKGEKVLRAVFPNAGIQAEYRRRLDAMINDMAASYQYWIAAAYRANETSIAMDAKQVRVTAVETQIGTNARGRVWFSFVDGEMLRGKNGVGRTWNSRVAAETAGIKAAGAQAIVTEAIKHGSRFDFETLMSLPVPETPVGSLQERLSTLGAQWSARIDAAAPKLAEWFRQAVSTRSGAALKKILKEGGMSVEFQMTPAMRNVAQASVAENVALIRSIGEKYHSQVEGMVMRSVTTGRDLGGLVKELEHELGLTRKRAAFIALDQNNKMTANFTTVRQIEVGITDAIWLHSHAGKVPRPTHLANNGKRYSVAAGWYDPDPKVKRFIRPGELPRCRCTSRSVVKGFT